MAKTIIISGEEVGANANKVNYTNDSLDVDNVQDALDYIVENGTGGTSTTASHTLTLANVDKLLLVGNSFTEGAYYIPGKCWVNSFSELLDYSVEAYGYSGADASELNGYINNNELRNNVIGPQDMGCTRAIILNRFNDMRANSLDTQYGTNMDTLCRTLEKFGMKPIISSEHAEFGPYSSQIIFESLAKAHDTECWMIYPTCEWLGNVVDNWENQIYTWGASQYVRRWFVGPHPGQRTGNLLVENLVAFSRARLPRPQSAIKIYRKRGSSAGTSIADRWTKISNWQEIMLAHSSLPDSAIGIWDNLGQYDSNTTHYVSRVSEYGTLQNGSTVASTYGVYLLEVIAPTNKENCTSLTVSWASNTPDSIQCWDGSAWVNAALGADLSSYLIGDKISILCTATNIAQPTITWSGTEIVKPSFKRDIRRPGTEQLATIDAATIDSTLGVAVTNYPYYPTGSSSYAVKADSDSRVVEVDNSDKKLIVDLESCLSSFGTLPEMTLRIIARWNPEVNSENVTETSLDRKRILVEGKTYWGTWSRIGLYDVGMHWALIEIPMSVINNRGAAEGYTQQIRVSGETCAMEIAIVSQLLH